MAAKKPKVPLEHAEQVAFFKLVDMSPRTKHLPIYAIPNFAGFMGSAVSRIVQGGRAKAEGRRKGFPDIGVDVAVEQYYGLRIEMKRVNRSLSRVSPEQIEWHQRLRKQGYAVAVCYGAVDAWDTLNAYLFSAYTDTGGANAL